MHAPRTSSVPLLIVAVALLGCQTMSPPAQARATVDGTWMAVSAQRNGQPDPGVIGHRLTFAGNTFVIRSGGVVLYEGTFTTDPTRAPAHIDFLHSTGALAGRTWRGVYAVDGDTLQITDNAPDPTMPRPTLLTTTAGAVMVVFKRSEP